MPTETLNAVAAVGQEIPTWFVCAMGVGIVFIGLICLIVLSLNLLGDGLRDAFDPKLNA